MTTTIENPSLTAEDEILVNVLADSDALWLTVRDFSGNMPGRVSVMRDDFHSGGGIPWGSGKTSEIGRKRTQLALERNVAAGLIAAVTLKGSKTQRVRLTEKGDARARAMVDMPSLRDSMDVVRQVAALSNRNPKLVEDCWIPEDSLIEKQPDADARRRALISLEDSALPALTRRLLWSRSTARMNAMYAVTAAGWAWLDGGGELPAAEPVAVSDEAFTMHDRRMADAIARLKAPAAEDREREIGEIPLPVAYVGVALSLHDRPDKHVVAAWL